MIIDEIVDNIFNSDCQTLTNPVNMVGVMGKGLALNFANRFPEILPIYKYHCSNKTFYKEKLAVVKLQSNKQVLLFPTKEHWKQDSNIWLLEHNLKILSRDYQELEITSLAIPKIGCGLGKQSFDEVRTLIFKYLDPIDIPVKIYV